MLWLGPKAEIIAKLQPFDKKMAQSMTLVPARHNFIFLFGVMLLLETSTGDPRTDTVKMVCSKQLEHNPSVFAPNFIATMENISKQMQTSGFGVAITGSGPDANYGLAQCYGDLSLVDCVLCYAVARPLLSRCYPYNGGRIYLDGCFMRAENYSFFEEYAGSLDTNVCGNTTRKNPAFEASATQAVMQAIASAPTNKGYAQAQVPVPGNSNESAYVLADCWRTLNQTTCNRCLESASKSILKCLPWSEGRALYTGCFMRYSNHDFLNKEEKEEVESSRGSIIVIIITVVSALVVLAAGIAIGYYLWKHKNIQKKRRASSHDADKLAKTLHDSSLNFKYPTLEKATGSFDDANKLGQGGFGTVYKGILPDGREIAVKRLFFNNKHRAADFYNEVNIISSVEHKNLVRLLGCSCSGPESLLVYEYLPNQSLDRFIFDQNRGKELNWEKRYDIILGTAEGLVYLHENSNTKIIHRDIKASNILLDSRLHAKIADFGLVRTFQEDKSHISTAVAGTLGYMAPEYLAHGQLTEKVDVYSFGLLLLETVTGRQNNKSKDSEDSESLVIIVWRNFQSGTVEELYDPNIMLHNNDDRNIKQEIIRVVHIGLLCTQAIPTLRPTMSKALEMLRNNEEPLPAPTNPPFIDERTMEIYNAVKDPSHPCNAGASGSIATVSSSLLFPR